MALTQLFQKIWFYTDESGPPGAPGVTGWPSCGLCLAAACSEGGTVGAGSPKCAKKSSVIFITYFGPFVKQKVLKIRLFCQLPIKPPRIEASALTPVRSLRRKKGNAIGERSAREKAVCRRTRNRIQIRSAFSFWGAFLLLFLSSKFQFRLHIRLYLFVSVDAR